MNITEACTVTKVLKHVVAAGTPAELENDVQTLAERAAKALMCNPADILAPVPEVQR